MLFRMNQADINARLKPFSEREIARFLFRAALFVRRGLKAQAADQTADRLALRDQEHDPRHLCLECSHLQRSGHCFAAAQGWMAPGTPKRYEPVSHILMRCEAFAWQLP